MRLLLIRHAESLANAEGRLQGHMEFSLSERGHRQAGAIAERLGPTIDALYTSPLLRAKETAEYIGSRSGLELQERPDLMERNWGEAEGLTREEIIARFPHFMPARTETRRVEIPGFEQDDALTRRAMQALTAIIEAHPQQTVAVVTHGGVIVTYCKETLHMPTIRPWPFAIDNGSITTFDVADGEVRPGRTRVQLVSLNDTCHLDGRP